MKQKLKNKKGFTLVELVVVIAIIALLAYIIVPEIKQYIAKTKEQTARENINAYGDAVTRYYIEMGDLPSASTVPELKDILTKKIVVDGTTKGPWLKKSPIDKDPWGREFEINMGKEGEFNIVSKGANESDSSDDIEYSGSSSNTEI